MDNEPSEVVFAATSLPTDSALVFRYGDGPVKVPAPRKRGRPVGCASGNLGVVNLHQATY
jgi:hypothetical protein